MILCAPLSRIWKSNDLNIHDLNRGSTCNFADGGGHGFLPLCALLFSAKPPSVSPGGFEAIIEGRYRENKGFPLYFAQALRRLYKDYTFPAGPRRLAPCAGACYHGKNAKGGLLPWRISS